ncbi:MAG: hypothetical protein P1R58_11720 [bacterium]|nr:hypothetical protein [bacterium]
MKSALQADLSGVDYAEEPPEGAVSDIGDAGLGMSEKEHKNRFLYNLFQGRNQLAHEKRMGSAQQTMNNLVGEPFSDDLSQGPRFFESDTPEHLRRLAANTMTGAAKFAPTMVAGAISDPLESAKGLITFVPEILKTVQDAVAPTERTEGYRSPRGDSEIPPQEPRVTPEEQTAARQRLYADPSAPILAALLLKGLVGKAAPKPTRATVKPERAALEQLQEPKAEPLDVEVKPEAPTEIAAQPPIEAPKIAELPVKLLEAVPKAKAVKAVPKAKAVKQSDLFSRETPKQIEAVDVKKGTSSASLGSPGSTALTRMDVSMEKAGKDVVSRTDVVTHFRNTFKLPIRVGKFREKAVGIYKSKPEVIRSREANDLTTISHELGHHLEKKIYGGSGRKSQLKVSKEANAELLKMGRDLYGSRKPAGGYRSEGFAEYMAHWLTTDKAKEVSPKFTEYFENKFLKENPDIAKNLSAGRDLVRKWRQQGAVARVYANIDWKHKSSSMPIKDKLTESGVRFNSLMADAIAPLEYVEKKMRGVSKLDPMLIDPMTSPTMLSRYVAETSNSKARSMVMDGVYDFSGKKVGPSLREIVAPVSKNIQEALTYAYARRALEVHKKGINPGITKEDASYVVGKLKSPEFENFADGITQFENSIVDYLVESGGMSREVADVMMNLNQSHIPLKRAVEGSFVSGRRKMADLNSPIKRLKGSGLPIKNPLESVIENTAAIINFADKARVGRALINLAESKEGAGKWVEKIPAPQQAAKFSLEQMKKQLEDAGVDLSTADMEQVLTVYSNAGVFKGRDNIVSFFEDGEREFYQIHPLIYRSFKALDQLNLNVAVEWLAAKPARAVRLGATGLNAGFGLITNPLRDAVVFGLQTEFSSGSPHLVLEGLAHRFTPNDKMYLLYRRSGADLSQFLGMDKRQMQKAVREVVASDKLSKAQNVVLHPLEGLKEVFSVTESGPRLAEFEAAYKKAEAKYGKGSSQALVIAANASSEVTTNFRKSGLYSRFLNQILPFYNPATQGLTRFYRFAKEHPAKAGIKGLIYLTFPTLGIWAMNRDEEWYKDLDPWQRYGFWNIRTGDNPDGSPKIMRIPRPFEWGSTFAVAPEIAIDYWYNKDPKILTEGIKEIYDQTSPVGLDDMPVLLKAGVEWSSNYDYWRDRPIDPYFEKKLKDPKDRFSPYTTETAKELGAMFNLSPRKIEHSIGSLTGGLGLDLIRAGEQAFDLRKEEGGHPASLPVVGRLYQRTETPEHKAKSESFQIQERVGKINKDLEMGQTDEAKEKLDEWNRLNPNNQIEYYADKQKHKPTRIRARTKLINNPDGTKKERKK